MGRCRMLVMLALGVGCGSTSSSATGADAPPAGGSSIDAPLDAAVSMGGTPDGPRGTKMQCPPYQSSCHGACIDTVSDPLNCGGCGITCTGNLACSGGLCSATCLPGLSICGNSCVDKSTDNKNCGTCGHTCGAGEGCAGGNCVTAVVVPTPASCQGSGPPIEVPVPGGQPVCGGNLAQRTFTWALCSCKDVNVSSDFRTDAFDSSRGPYMPGGIGGAVGLDGRFNGSDHISIGGTLWASASGGVSLSSGATIGQELHSGGPVSVSSRVTVAEDGFVVGNVSGGGELSFGGDLHVSPDAGVSGTSYKTL